jgi:hypothetical protein
VIQLLRQLLTDVLNFLLPGQYFAWQTVIYMSLFSWLMSLLAAWVGELELTVTLLTTLSWIFLAIGVGWGIDQSNFKPFGLPIAPWVSGAIVCIFLFGTWSESWFQPALATWPLISFLVVAFPNLVNWDLSLKIPVPETRQRLILLFFLSLLLSSWSLFYFRIQSWARDYPSLVAENLTDSQFVYPLPTQSSNLSAGVTHLTIAAEFIQDQLTGKPWSWTERWLLNLEGQQQAMQEQVNRQLRQRSPEDPLWDLRIRPVANENGYDLKLLAIWNGPSANANGYYLEKSCLLMPVNQPSSRLRSGVESFEGENTNISSTTLANVMCDLENQRHSGNP